VFVLSVSFIWCFIIDKVDVTFSNCMQNGGHDAKHKTATKRKKSETPAKKVGRVRAKLDVNM